ncbi:MAG: type II toxin-antitoxin system VapC family toxin [Patulibacter sp.]|nr:type II toxin-antitoxin system VapC family toxin [Patulibacter sp.]
MKLLLDTNILIWFLQGSSRIGDEDRALIESGASEVSVSAVSIFEIATKVAISKLTAPHDLAALVTGAGFRALPLGMRHAEAVRDLPLHHRDPFDRLLVAQARIEGLTLITADRQLAAYDVTQIQVGIA